MADKNSERRYNTRFRGVPRSVFTYSRKKASTKSNNENIPRSEIKNDFVYTKLGKKPNYEKELASPPKVKIKTEPVSKQDKKSSKAELKQNTISNGTHKQPSEKDMEEAFKIYDDSPLKIDESIIPFNDENIPLTTDTVTKKSLETAKKSQKVPPIKVEKTSHSKKEDSSLKIDESTIPFNDENIPFTTDTDTNKSFETAENSVDKTQKVPPAIVVKTSSSKKEKVTSFKIDQLLPAKMEKVPSPEIIMKVEESSPESSPRPDRDMDGIFFEPKLPPDDIHSNSSNGIKSLWIPSKEKLSWNNCTVASYNPKTKMFRCVVCQAVGFMSRIGEHYLGTHCNAKVFHCPQCSYCSAWWRCVRNHMSKNHGVSNAPASMWKNQPLLDEIMQILQNLKYSVDCEDRVEKIAENSGKRYICPKCPYATDRRDLYNRHENIHREEKPFQCYICYKLFNRADHVKKHFCRIHKEFNYDINLIRRLPSKRSRIPVSPSLANGSIAALQEMNSSLNENMQKPSVPVTQSQLLTCLTGSPTLVRMNREIDNAVELSEKDASLSHLKNSSVNNTTSKDIYDSSHSNLLTYLTQTTFSPKPITKPTLKNTEFSPKDILQEALTKPSNFSPYNNIPKKYSCPYCPWTGPNSWALRIHTSMHYKTFCVLCNFKSSEISDLERHMWESHKKRCCNKCNFLGDSLIALDIHLKEAHGQKSLFSCRHCAQSFEVRSDMEAHCIFIHNQILQECKDNGCDFCTTDPDVLDIHKKELHNNISSSPSEESSASRTLCLYCGCEFADPQSLTLHEELFHENPLQRASRRPLNPYGCSVCGYSTPKQPMMIEHMRIHTGQTLRCQAGDGCLFDTPYDTVLREHVLQSHSNDDGIVRCPHCGLRCSTRPIFVSHYKELHHPFCCALCEEVEHKHFVLPASSLDFSIKAMFPFAKQVGQLDGGCPERFTVDGRRSRKQTQPRKVVPQMSSSDLRAEDSRNNKWKTKCISMSNERYLSLYVRRVRKIAQVYLLRCRFCIKSPIYFRHKQNYIRHMQWHGLMRYKCNKCIQTFCHRYQVLLHQREHTTKTKLLS